MFYHIRSMVFHCYLTVYQSASVLWFSFLIRIISFLLTRVYMSLIWCIMFWSGSGDNVVEIGSPLRKLNPTRNAVTTVELAMVVWSWPITERWGCILGLRMSSRCQQPPFFFRLFQQKALDILGVDYRGDRYIVVHLKLPLHPSNYILTE